MTLKQALLLSTMLALTACGGGNMRPKYSGHEEPTAGLPGFDAKGKKLNPHVKLGQSYSVDGETYVPKYEPGYVQEGMASWYGPGFHGGKTANGERYDSSEMTAAHRTLPLPSMVRVTLLKTGKSAIVRVNDRGPYAHGRIIDLSKAAADAVGLTKMGTGKVRVEYLEQETRRFTTLMAGGRNPKDIDVDSEVLAFVDQQRNATSAMVADATDQLPSGSPFDLANENNEAAERVVAKKDSTGNGWLSRMSPIGSAHAESPYRPLSNGDSVNSNDLPPPELPASGTSAAPAPTVEEFAPIAPASAATNSAAPIIVPKNNAVQIVPKNAAASAAPAKAAASSVIVPAEGSFLQLGAFASKANAEALVQKISDIGAASLNSITLENGQSIYRVRLGPYADADNLAKALAKLQARGLDAKPISE